MFRPTYARIDLDAVLHNYRQAVALAPNSQTLAVIKADAYGHGALAVAKKLAGHAPAFAVACIDEALALRNAGIHTPILLLEGFYDPKEIPIAAQHGFWMMIHDEAQLDILSKIRLDKPLHCWLKLDTGMHRLGTAVSRLPQMLQRLAEIDSIAPDPVLATHFACSEELQKDMTTRQIADFYAGAKCTGLPLSLANSAAVYLHEASHAQWNRPGIMLYGSTPLPGKSPAQLGLRAAMQLYSQIFALRELKPGETVGYGARWTARRPSRIATLAIGYADGYPRLTDSSTQVYLHGRYAPVVGTVSMDMLAVDVTDVPEAKLGDQVELWGEKVLVSDVAAAAHTIGYELLTKVTLRVPRHYIGQD
ncbi:alanine racemase [Aliiglaciecola sp. CAU 1673]|uniref:alanine racemase n=1 Tax=Aliiglaciecola sp. CAU 1673 TaxID=3032595 RepID=UPI0023DA061A|nr:alanine racemase [Aliiglaciecola sp. CAU 1673]MDF2177335.1 alanine racemase [Aliiglaciecola sp. CAU 1673]